MLQLGYSVSCGVRDTYGIMGFGFVIVSSSHSVQDILTALLLFIHAAPALVRGMESSAFQHNLEALIHSKLEPTKSVSEAAEVNWAQIDEKQYNFSLKQDQVTILKEPTLVNSEVLAQFTHDLFLGPERKLMIVASSLAGDHLQSTVPPSEYEYKNICIHTPAELLAVEGVSMYPGLM